MKFKSIAIILLVLALCFTASAVWAGKIVIKGSTTVLPIAQKVAEAYMKQNPDVKISISGGGSGNGIKALIDGSTDIADSSRFIKPKEVKLAVDKTFTRVKSKTGKTLAVLIKKLLLSHATPLPVLMKYGKRKS